MTVIALAARELEKEYRIGGVSVRALRSVTLEIARGEFVAIVGPSGCGKSTLLNLLGGLDHPTRGTVLVDGVDLASVTVSERAALRRTKVGFVFQTFALIPTLTARENVELPLILDGVSSGERADRAEQLLASVGLANRTDFLPDELSGGQKQRVGIARALANAPAILLADEPTGNLDRPTATATLDLLVALRRAHDLTLVIVTHDPDDARRADRQIELRDGVLVNDGRVAARAPEEVR